MAQQTVSKLGAGEQPIGSAKGGGMITNKGNIYYAPSTPATQAQASKQNVPYQGAQKTSAQPMQQSQAPQPMQSSGASLGNPDDYNKMLDDAFNPIMGALDQAESNTRGQQQSILDEIAGQATANESMLTTQKGQTVNRLGEQQVQGQRSANTQEARNRQTLQELNQGNTQRFGGATSAGQASSEIQGREFMRNQGEVQQKYQDFTQQINTKKEEVEQNFQSSLLQLQQAKQAAMNQAQRDFQQKLLDIANTRAESQQAKAMAKLNALMDYRDKAFQLQREELQYQRTLDSQKQTSLQALNSYTGLTNQATQTGATAGSQLESGMAQTNNYSQPKSNGQASYYNNGFDPTLMGRITNTRKNDQLLPYSPQSLGANL